MQPDIITFAKAVTSAYVPLSAPSSRSDIHERFLSAEPDQRFMHGFTNAGHPAACAVACATSRFSRTRQLVDRAERLGTRLNEGLGRLRRNAECWRKFAASGSMAAVEVVADKTRGSRAPLAGGVAGEAPGPH